MNLKCCDSWQAQHAYTGLAVLLSGRLMLMLPSIHSNWHHERGHQATAVDTTRLCTLTADLTSTAAMVTPDSPLPAVHTAVRAVLCCAGRLTDFEPGETPMRDVTCSVITHQLDTPFFSCCFQR